MSFKYKFSGTFTADGYAKSDKKLLDALHIRPHTTAAVPAGTTFQLTETLPKLTQTSLKGFKDQPHKQHTALTIEECKPEGDYREGFCIPLPSNVSYNSIYSNIISSFQHSFQAQKDKELKQLKDKFRARKSMKKTGLYPQDVDEDDINEKIIRQLDEEEDRAVKKMEFEEAMTKEKVVKKLEAWSSYLKMNQNKYVLSDAFWYMKYHIVPDSESQEITEFLLERMARNYIELFLSVGGGHKESFFKNFFNILSQGVFYSFFYACPKSRDDLNDDIKGIFLTQFSVLFAGIELANPRDYFAKWYLDLGAGNILKNNDFTNDFSAQLPSIVFKDTLKLKVLRTQQDLRYSPIILTYLSSKNYKTRNVVKGYKMNFSKIATDKEEVEKKFELYKQVAKKVNEDLEKFKEEDRIAQANLKRELRKMREESWQHQRRLSRRRDEELEKGAHEYANYLVSMLNSNNQGGRNEKL